MPEKKDTNLTHESSTRKKFLRLGAIVLGSAVVVKLLGTKKGKPDTVKMLTQDGTLVEIDKNLISESSKKISSEELKQWVKPRQGKH